jgi:hypothetical protein
MEGPLTDRKVAIITFSNKFYFRLHGVQAVDRMIGVTHTCVTVAVNVTVLVALFFTINCA